MLQGVGALDNATGDAAEVDAKKAAAHHAVDVGKADVGADSFEDLVAVVGIEGLRLLGVNRLYGRQHALHVLAQPLAEGRVVVWRQNQRQCALGRDGAEEFPQHLSGRGGGGERVSDQLLIIPETI